MYSADVSGMNAYLDGKGDQGPKHLTCGATCSLYLPTSTVSVTTAFEMSDASLTAMLANKAAAVAGLKSGIATGLGVESSAVVITATNPDLLGSSSRRLKLADFLGSQWTDPPAIGRRLATTLAVDFDVTGDSTVTAQVDSLTSGDSTVVASVTSAVESSLAAQSITVSITSVAATKVTGTAAPTSNPAPTPAPTTLAPTTAAPAATAAPVGARESSGVKPVTALTGVMLVLLSVMQ
jgi:hypothetical protein